VSEDRGALVGVTGANGFLGSSLVAALRTEKFDVVEYRRSTTNVAATGMVREFDLGRPVDSRIFEGVTCLIHTAWDLRETDSRRAWERNVEGSKRLIDVALNSDVQRVIFISSMSAYFGTKQDYGLMKLAVERAVLEAGQIVVRPGLVYGGASGGMALTLSKLARLPVIPIFRGAQQFTVDLDDFLNATVLLVREDKVPSSIIGLAHERPTSFRDIMLALAPQGDGVAKTVVVPWHLVLESLRVAESLKIPLPVRSDSLLGLVRPAPFVPGQDIAARMGLSFRSFDQSRAKIQAK
jgi:nucleoside-diphosphate-sugar epimerase